MSKYHFYLYDSHRNEALYQKGFFPNFSDSVEPGFYRCSYVNNSVKVEHPNGDYAVLSNMQMQHAVILFNEMMCLKEQAREEAEEALFAKDKALS